MIPKQTDTDIEFLTNTAMKPNLTTGTSQKLVSKDAPSERFLEIRIETPKKESANRPPLNLGIVIDRSGSMSGDKLIRAKQAAEYVLDQLTERDRVSIVIYDDSIDVIAVSDFATSTHVRRCKSALREVAARGTTALFDGWLRGCNDIADYIKKGIASRVLLLTDGLANVGVTDSPSICEHVRALFERGISTSTFGIGADFDEDLLSDMADAGRGRFYYIEHAGLIPDAFRQEFGDLASVVASNATLTVSLDPAIRATVLGGIPNESDGGRLIIPIGDLYDGETRPYYFQLDVPPSAEVATVEVAASLTFEMAGADGAAGKPEKLAGQAVFKYAPAAEVEADPVDEALMRKVADVHIAEARIEAMNLNRAGRYADAQRVMGERAAKYRAHRSAQMYQDDMRFAGVMESELDPLYRKMNKQEALRRSRVRRRRDDE